QFADYPIVKFIVAIAMAASACSSPPPSTPATPMNTIAERYVKLVLDVGQHDPAYVDAFYGPPEWKAEAEKAKRPLADIDADAAALLRELGKHDSFLVAGSDEAARKRETELVELRFEYLTKQVGALRAKVSMLEGKKLTFDEESKALYDAEAPTHI